MLTKSRGLLAARAVAVLVAAVLVGACGDDGNDDSGSSTGSAKKLHVGFAAAVKDDPVHDAIAEVTEALVKKRGWDYSYVNNNVDGPTAVSNAKLLVNKGVDAVIEFQVDATVMPTISRIFAAKDIPWVTYSVPGPGAWIVGKSDIEAGIEAGKALGEIAKDKWDCQPDLVMLLEQPQLPAPNKRVTQVPEGFKKVCPDVSDDVFKSGDGGDGSAAKNQEAARNILVANPDAKKILFASMTDEGVGSGLTAAKQLGRYGDAWGWGQGGELIATPKGDPHLLGSVMYFLEGYPVYAIQVLDKVAAGNPPPKGKEDDTESPTAIRTTACNMSAEEAAKIPDLTTRVKKLLAAPTGTTLGDLYCPKS